MTRVTGDWLHRPETQAVCSMLTGAGHRALFVGGCVRNTLLGEPVSDIDISTDATPDIVSNLAEQAGLRPVPTGVDHGTVTVVSGGLPHEVTTFRHDVETFGRHAVVAYTDRVEEDAVRRDFTMNALYAEPDGTLVDPLGGLADLRARRVRFIKDASARIHEDYLRILRFFRFHAWYGDPVGGLDAEGLAACAALSAGIETLARERVGAEMRKLLSAPDPAPALAAMAAAGCLARALPGADPAALAPLVELEANAGLAPDPVRRLAAVGGEDPRGHLRLSRSDARRLDTVGRAARDTAGPAELGYRLGPEDGRDALLVRGALTGTPVAQAALNAVETGGAATFPLTAADLMPEYVGPALGARLAELETKWIASGFALTRHDLLN